MQLLIVIGFALLLVLALKVAVDDIERELTRRPVRYHDGD
jgi:hypothetical protein